MENGLPMMVFCESENQQKSSLMAQYMRVTGIQTARKTAEVFSRMSCLSMKDIGKKARDVEEDVSSLKKEFT